MAPFQFSLYHPFNALLTSSPFVSMMKSVALFSAAVASYASVAQALLVNGAAEGFAKGVTGGGVQ